MRYLKASKNGTWQFRFQIPHKHRHLFSDVSEYKKTLNTKDKEQATLKALRLELDIRTAIYNKSFFTPPTENQTINHKSPKKTKRICAYQALTMYSESRKDLASDKTIAMSHAKVKTVLALLSTNNLRDIRRLEANKVRQLLHAYPVNAKKQKDFIGLEPKEILKLNEVITLPTLSVESVKDYIQKSSSFFEWCLQMELTDINPFKGIKFKKKRKDSEAKNSYTAKQLSRIFYSEIFVNRSYKHPYQYWLPILGVFTGARLNELCQLYRNDVYVEKGIWVIRIDERFSGQKLKNTFSRRVIPLHKEILRLGFLEYIDSLPNDKLFPELTLGRDGYASNASKWFGRYKTKLGFEKGYDFHSFRHTFATYLKNNGVPASEASELLGHSQSNITYDRYGKSIHPSRLVSIVNSIPSNFLPKTCA
ncbi:tyrosine-type recombinase/integrase [Vibrio profundi]|uniref:tyrosine-type recombinase/integrase n=1 Tax=Vibrio profundi TaxID=1774960 RepID=UPI003736B494